MRLIAITLCLALAAVSAARAADAPPDAPDDLDALSIADKAPTTPVKPAQKLRVFVEAAGGRDSLPGRTDTSRAAIDLRYDDTLAPGLRGVVSDRFDWVHPGRLLTGSKVNTLREAYLSWAPSPDQIFDIGRVNIRHGAAVGFNPTDFFKEGALRAIVSPDPAVLRENRQGTVVLQGQKLWSTGSLTATLSPKLGDAPSASSFSLNAGATNPRTRWLLAGSYKLGEKLNPELLLYGGVHMPTQLGVNVSGLIGSSTVAFLEFSAAKHDERRAALGATYTTGFNLSFTAEGEYNSKVPTSLAAAQELQDLPVRRALFFHATWHDALVRRLDLSGFVRRSTHDASRAQWLETRYHWDRADLSLQWQFFSGSPNSAYGSVPQRRAVELALRVYL